MSAAPAASPFRALLGRFATLVIRRVASAGAFLAETGAGPDAETLLLLGPEIPPGARVGDPVDVFVTLDSEGRPLATMKTPRLALGEVAFLTVTACTDFGAFVDGGLPKEVLVPFAEQTRELHVGGRHAIGLFVIVERRFVGLLPRHEPHTLRPGDAARFRVAHVHPDGKIELSLRAQAHEELERDAAAILAVLARPGAPTVGDRSPPDEIRARFGLSKKAFKRAVGTLLKTGRVDVDPHGRVRLLQPKR